jgi:hypothetical protein
LDVVVILRVELRSSIPFATANRPSTHANPQTNATQTTRQTWQTERLYFLHRNYTLHQCYHPLQVSIISDIPKEIHKNGINLEEKTNREDGNIHLVRFKFSARTKK